MSHLSLAAGTNLGGHPISLNDLNYLQNGQFNINETFGGQHVANLTNVILTPLNVTISGSTFSMLQVGKVIYNRHLIPLLSASNSPLSTTTGAQFKLQLITSYGANNPVIYENGNSHNVHIDEVLILVHTHLTGGDYIEISSFNNLSQWINANALITLGGGINTSAGSSDFRFRMISQNMMCCYLMIDGNSQAGAHTLTLPYPWKLKRTTHIVVHALHTGTDSRAMLLKGSQDSDTFTFETTTENALPASGTFDIKGAYFQMEVYFDPRII